MTPTCRSTRLAWLAFASMTASCATRPPTPVVAPPRLSIPQQAATPCALPTLPDAATLSDLDAAYLARGLALAACDAARTAAVETLEAERTLIDRWLGR